jgi:anti-sigma factor RsiW
MDEHAFVRDRLTLAVAGALDAAGQRQVEEHLRECADCRAEFEAWGRLGGALEALPTPQAPPGLLERTRRQLENRAAAHAARRHSWKLLVGVGLLAWVSMILTWPLLSLFGDSLSGLLDVSAARLNQVWIGYIVVSWTLSIVVAGLLGHNRRQERVL